MNLKRAIRFLRPGVKFWFNGFAEYDYLVWTDISAKPTLLELEAADLAAAKDMRIKQAKAEAGKRIVTAYPYYAQSNAALGLYDTLPENDPFQTDNMKAGIQTIIDAEHAAEAAINALTDSNAVDSFTW